MNVEHIRDLKIGSSDRGGVLNRFAFWRDRGREKLENTSDGRNLGSTEPPKDLLLPDAHIIADVLPLDPNSPNPIRREDIMEIIKWVDHPSVVGHIYQLESTRRRNDLSRWDNFLLYYSGAINDKGEETDSSDSTFFKAVNNKRGMLANCRVLWKGVEFVKRSRTAYLERLIVKPELQGRKIGTAFCIDVLDFIFYMSRVYNGLPATEVRGSTYVDKQASGLGKGHVGFDRNELFLRQFGFEKDGHTRDLEDGRTIQPWKLSLAKYEATRAKAIESIANDQPERKEYLESVWLGLRETLRGKDPTYARNFS